MTYWARKLSRRRVLKTLALACGAVVVKGHHRPGHRIPPGHGRRSSQHKRDVSDGVVVDDMREPYSMEIS